MVLTGHILVREGTELNNNAAQKKYQAVFAKRGGSH